MELNDRIRYLRKELLNLTLDQFGEKIGLKKSALSHLENGNVKLTDQSRRSICREFGVNEEWLLTGEGEPFPKKTRHDEIADFVNSLAIDDNSFKARFIAALSRMSEEEWLLVEKVVREVASDTVAPVQQAPTTEDLEAEYKKIHSSDASDPGGISSASNTTAESGDGETA